MANRRAQGATETHRASEAGVDLTAAADREPAPHRKASAVLRNVGWLLTALILGVLAILWVVQNELIHSSIQVGNSVPPIPTLAAVLLLGGCLALWMRFGRPADDTAPA